MSVLNLYAGIEDILRRFKPIPHIPHRKEKPLMTGSAVIGNTDIGVGATVRLKQHTNTQHETEGTVLCKSERQLLAAILARAICDALGPMNIERHIRRQARCWLFRKLTPKKPFTLAWVAQHLDLDPVALQERLFYLRDNPQAALEASNVLTETGPKKKIA